MMPALRALIFTFGLAVLAVHAWAQPGSWSEIVVFGDSLSDVGNVHQRSDDVTFGLFVQPDDRYDRGRFSNGDVWVERVAEALGLDASTRSYRADGTNYAYGAATTGGGSSNLTITRNVGWQVDEYLVREARTPSAGTLVVLWAGANNFLGGGTDTSGAAADMLDHVGRLYDAGARQFLVPNLPPLGQTPRFKGGPDEAARDATVGQYNDALAAGLDAFTASVGDAEVFALDVETIFEQLLNNPAAFGITNTTDAAIDLPSGTDVSGYLFWDDVHPTATGHALISQAALDLLLAALPGDYNASGQVEQGDLDLVLQNWGIDTDATGVPTGWTGELPQGVIEQSELDGVLANWGAANAPHANRGAVPEPSALVVLGGGGVMCGFRTRRKSVA